MNSALGTVLSLGKHKGEYQESQLCLNMWLFSPYIPKCFSKRSGSSCDFLYSWSSVFSSHGSALLRFKGVTRNKMLCFSGFGSFISQRLIHFLQKTCLQGHNSTDGAFPSAPQKHPPLHPSPVLIFCSVSTPILAPWPPNSMMVSKSRACKKAGY